jgi:hypothetical protein
MVTIRTNPEGKGFQWGQSGRVNTTKTEGPSFVPSVPKAGKSASSQRRPCILWERASVSTEQPDECPKARRGIEGKHRTLGSWVGVAFGTRM